MILRYTVRLIQIKKIKMMNQHQEIVNFITKYQVSFRDSESIVVQSNQGTYLAKTVQLDPKTTDLDTVLQTLQQHQTLNPQHMLTLLNYTISKSHNNSEQTVKTIYQYANLSLEEELSNRRTINQQFKEEELWAIIYSITRSLEYLEKLNIGYGVLGCDKIFIDNKIKLLDPSAVAEDPLTLAPHRLYSPEVIYEHQNIDIIKSDVFVLGLCILEAVLLLPLSSEEMPQYDQTKLKIYLGQVQNIYGAQLSTLLQQMLEQYPDDRPTFAQIRQYLENALQLVEEQSDHFLPLPEDIQDPQNTMHLNDQTQQFQIWDQEDEQGSSSGLAASLNQYQRAKLRFLSQSRATVKELSQIEEDSSYSNMLHGISDNFEFQKKKPSKTIKNKVVKDTSNLQLQVIQISEYQKNRQHSRTSKSSYFPLDSSHNHVFTSPKLMEQIQKQLKQIATNRSSKQNINSNY